MFFAFSMLLVILCCFDQSFEIINYHRNSKIFDFIYRIPSNKRTECLNFQNNSKLRKQNIVLISAHYEGKQHKNAEITM